MASALPRMRQPNTTHQARGVTGARHERTLFPVPCMRLFGADGAIVACASAGALPSHALAPSRPACSLRSRDALLESLACAGLPNERSHESCRLGDGTRAPPVGLC